MTATATQQNIQAIAKTLVEKCRKGQYEEATKELYDQNIVSIEPHDTPNSPKETKGLDAILEKSKKWMENTEIHSQEVSEPLVAGNQFVVKFTIDATCKQTKERGTMEELGVYAVENGKIVREQFFYDFSGK